MSMHQESLEDTYGAFQDEQLSDDDNAAPEMQSEVEEGENEDPLQLAIDDLEGRVMSALNDFKLHLGVRSSSAPGSPTVHEELREMLQSVLEVAAHTGPSVARTYYQGIGQEGIELSCEEVYERLVSDLILPVVLEETQTDPIPAKRVACLEFFRHLFKECQKSGSWMDSTTTGPQMGPYGAGASGSHSSHHPNVNNPAIRAQQKRRFGKKLAREGEILRYWVQASISSLVEGVFTSEASEMAVASRGIIAASSSLRPCLKHIAQRIKDADDRGASKLFSPMMKMVEGVLKKLFLSSAEETAGSGDGIRGAALKFMEILTLVCSRKPHDPSQRRRSQANSEEFSLEDLPAGHPVITRESLESIAEYSFAIFRGLTLLGGQARIDENLLSDMLMSGGGGSPSAQVVSILKPAALAYLEIESSLPGSEEESAVQINVDRNNIEFDFMLSQKPYSLTLNAMSALALNRPMFFKESALCLARRAVQPPVFIEGGTLSKSGVLAISAHLKAACLTLLRNALSVSAKASDILHEASKACDMEMQADKALSMAKQANSLRTAGRAARNRANMMYTWEEGDKRKTETDDALAKLKEAKKARGLGHGIQLPKNMAEAIDLVFANLHNLPSKKPTSTGSKNRNVPVNLDFLVDAILTNGASLAQEEGRWYDRDGGAAWELKGDNDHKFELSTKFTELVSGSSGNQKPRETFFKDAAASSVDALGRIATQALNSRSAYHAQLGNEIAARLAWTLRGTKPPGATALSQALVEESVASLTDKQVTAKEKEELGVFIGRDYPLVSSCLALDFANNKADTKQDVNRTLSSHLLSEAYVQASIADQEGAQNKNYQTCMNAFVASVVRAGKLADDKPSDADRKQSAALASTQLQAMCQNFPEISPSSLRMVGGLCDIIEVTKKASDAARKNANQTVAASAALHSAKAAAEKRATTVLLTLRDIAFSRNSVDARRGAVEAAVMIAAGRLPSSQAIEDKALKLVMNVLYPKSEILGTLVTDASINELKESAKIAASKHDEIATANNANAEKNKEKGILGDNPLSDPEREFMDVAKKPVTILMALCVRKPDLIKTMFEVSCTPKADALQKTVRANMAKMAKAAAAKHGAAAIANKVAAMTGPAELALLLAFLDNLTDQKTMNQEFIDACHEIQAGKAGEDGKKDPRFLIPVVAAMKRQELVEKLPDFVAAEDKIFLAALERMGDRVARQALLYRDEPDEENPSLKGMTLCEQLVFLHNLDFAAAGLPQKRYLDAIKHCLDNDEIYSDRVVMSALDHMSGVFLEGDKGLPLAYMRTIILVCSKHESLHSFITSTLLPRLVEGKIYTDRRQWEGWMRCAKMLSPDSQQAIQKLPKEQYELYCARYTK
ncbi:Symplekin [Seminavis robusta]|uniref:Symplekin n=1 Tax=Seminavis robusta TaxID=568900 RepID=A0A9N8ECM9_9STRA|nr:Symplekin [Seminavis robusta]|eukprot:Sro759_g198240.1 Symplekin (1365) ;mRNA; f:29302-33579